jgi:indolepyruvate ferredoxin oxidoreductase beta subunit
MIKNDTQSVVLVGVGGQGILLASEILAQAAMQAGFEVKTNEVHGMAQRGGSVMAQIRYGKDVHSPLVAKGSAQILGALEHVEALRYADYIAPQGLAAVSAESITPVTVSSGAASYPANVEEMLKKVFPRLVYIDAAKKATELGDVRAANIMLLGVISRGLDLPLDAWHKAIKQCVREKFLDLNMKAFELGRNFS